jgi:ABC-type phosphate transport system substrate-binding protein
MKRSALLLCIIILLAHGLATAQSNSPVVVVVAESNVVTSMSAQQVRDIFLGHSTFFSDGGTAVPVDQAENSAARIEFYARILDMTPAQLRSHWARMTFTGRGRPPRTVSSDADLIALLQQDNRIIGYLSRASINQDTKIVFEP